MSSQQSPLVPQPQAAEKSILDEVVSQHQQQVATMEVRFQRLDGRKETVRVPFPERLDSLTPLQVVSILQASPMWREFSGEFLLNAVAWCNVNGLDPIAGDVFPIEGKISTSDIAKIKNARRNPNLESFVVSDITEAPNPNKGGAKDRYAEATIKLRGQEPFRYRAWMSEWYNEKNKNWQKNPTDSLQRKAMARAAHFTCPIGSEGDEFIPVDSPEPKAGSLTAAVAAATRPSQGTSPVEASPSETKS